MKEINLKKLYEESISFKIYVDKVCNSYKMTKEQAFEDAIVKSYAEYVVKDQDDYARKECERESKTNYGCC